MDALTNIVIIALPFVIYIVYFLAVFYLVKTVVYVMQLPKKLLAMERRIRELEQKEDK